MKNYTYDQDYFNWDLQKKKNAFIAESTIKHVIKECGSTKPFSRYIVLDVGCGSGQFTCEIAGKVKKVVGVEPFKKAYLQAKFQKEKLKLKNVSFLNVPVEKFITKEQFDLVLCLTTLEHMPKASSAFNQIFKLLKSGGKIYLTVPNKLWPYEYHYRLPFLSWVPIKWANLIVRLTRRGDSFEDSAYAMSYLGIKRFFDRYPCIYRFVVPDSKEQFLGLGDSGYFYNLIKTVGIWLLKRLPFLWFFSKAFIMVVTKTDSNRQC